MLMEVKCFHSFHRLNFNVLFFCWPLFLNLIQNVVSLVCLWLENWWKKVSVRIKVFFKKLFFCSAFSFTRSDMKKRKKILQNIFSGVLLSESNQLKNRKIKNQETFIFFLKFFFSSHFHRLSCRTGFFIPPVLWL